MKRAAFPLAILAALVVGFAGSQVVSTAQAQTARTATCTIFGKLDGLRVVTGQQAMAVADQVLPPTELGWRSFLSAAPASNLTFTQLQEVGRYWWNRTIPRDLLSANKDASNTEMMEEAA